MVRVVLVVMPLTPRPLAMLEAVLDVLVFHRVAHVVAEQGDIHAGIVKFLCDGLPGAWHWSRRATGDLLHRGLPLGLLLGGERRTASSAARVRQVCGARALPPGARGPPPPPRPNAGIAGAPASASQWFDISSHFAQPNLRRTP